MSSSKMMKNKKSLLKTSLFVGITMSGCFEFMTSCVAEGTRVLTPNGWVLIENLKIGDLVISIDEQTGEQESSPIVAIKTATREVGQIILSDQALTVTTDHPIYDPNLKEYAPAGDWFLGKRTQLSIWTEEQHAPLMVQEVKESKTYISMSLVYDLTVQSQLHNFVANGILVHNKSLIEPDIQYGGAVSGGAVSGGAVSGGAVSGGAVSGGESNED